MATISLGIHIVKSNSIKTMQFEESMIVCDACRLIREMVPDAASGQPNEYGLFKPDADPTRGRWLEMGRTLEYYHLKSGDMLQYRKKLRPLRVRSLDSSIKTLLVDDSQTVAELTRTVCARIGLSKPEEFSFTFDDQTPEQTARRQGHHEVKDQERLDLVKKKPHSDDELNWLNPDKSLREQGIEETSMLTLRKKFFFSDQNVDRNDPIQLNLLFIQSKDAIVDGTHPCTCEDAILFAALQCQIQYGNHSNTKHKPGFLNLIEFLPREYTKIKGIEKNIFAEHRKFHNLSEINAKFRYIQLCRSLRTYGATFFLVKEKMRGRRKLVPRLLGITRESIMRVDDNTKEVLKTWPLTTVRRWAASPNSFTLDFGDYSESFYSVATTEGEAISQLIAGYIDIIMQKKKPIHMEEDEPALVEMDVNPKQAPVTGGNNQDQNESNQGKVQQAQRALQANIDSGLQTANAVIKDLQTRAVLPPLGTDSASINWKQTTLDVSRLNVSSFLAAILASTASVITHTEGDHAETNYTAVGSAVTTVSTNLTELAKAVRVLASLSSDVPTGDELLKAARALSAATAGLLNAAQPDNMKNRQQLLVSAGEMGTTGDQLLVLAGDAEIDSIAQETLVAMAKAVASAVAALLTTAKNVAAKCDNQALQNQVILAAKQTAQGLIACAKVLAPCIDSPLCQEQLIEAYKSVAAGVEKVVIAAQADCGDDGTLRDLGGAATAVTEALYSLIDHIKHISTGTGSNQYDAAVEIILSASKNLFSSLGNAEGIIRQGKILAEATSSLANAIKLESEKKQEYYARRHLLDAAKQLADGTYKMVEAAKAAAHNPVDEARQETLRKAADQLRNIAVSWNVIKKLGIAAKQSAAVATQCIVAAQGAAASNRNEASQTQLINHCEVVTEQISSLVLSVRFSISNPVNPSAQLGLINASQAMIPPSGKMVAAAKAVVPTVEDQAAALQLESFAKATALALTELRAASAKAAEVCSFLEIDGAIATVKDLSKDIAQYKLEASKGILLLLPGESVEASFLKLGATSKTVGSSMAQLLTAANQGNENYTDIAARDTASALGVLAHAVRGMAAGTKNAQSQEYILSTAQQVMDQSVALILEAKAAVQVPNIPNIKQLRLAQAARTVSQALNMVVNCLQVEFDLAIKAIEEASKKLQSGLFPSADGTSYQVLQSDYLSPAAAALNNLKSEVVVAARSTPELQAEATQKFSTQFDILLVAGLTLTGACTDKEGRSKMLEYLRTISVSSSKLLLAAKALSATPSASDLMIKLEGAALSVTDAIDSLLNFSSTCGPGQKECDRAIRSIEAAASVLDNLNKPVSDHSYSDCLDLVIEKSKVFDKTGALVTTHGEMVEFCKAVDNIASAVYQLTELSAQAAYLVGIADPSSAAAIPGLVDQAQFTRAQEAISSGCQNLLKPQSNQQQVLAAATVIAKHTSVLCNACKVASTKTANPVAKRHFVEAAKKVANCTASLVKNIKALAGDLSDANRQACGETSKPLMEAVEALITFASSPQFASTPAKFSSQACLAQESIISAGKNVCSSSSSLLSTAKSLAIDPNDPPTSQLLASRSMIVMDATKSLILAIKDKCPGQKECDKAIDTLNESVNHLDQAILTAMSQQLSPQDSTLQDFQEQMLEVSASINETVAPLASAAKGEAERLGHQVTIMASLCTNLAGAAVGAASKMASSQMQISVLEQTKALAESALQLMYVCKEAGGNPKSMAAHTKVDQATAFMEQAMDDLTTALEKDRKEARLISGMIEDVSKAMDRLDKNINVDVPGSYTDYQKDTLDHCKDMSSTTQDMVLKSSSNPGELTQCSKRVTDSYSSMVDSVRKALATTDTSDFADSLMKAMKDLGGTVKDLIYAGASVQGNPKDRLLKKDLSDRIREVTQKISAVVKGIQAGAVGTQSCNDAISAIAGMVGDLETTSMLCTAGALSTDSQQTSAELNWFAEIRQSILETAKSLEDSTKALVSSAASSQQTLAEAVQQALKTISKEVDNVKLGAAALGSDNIEGQLLLLTAAKDVANALIDLIGATHTASGKNVQDPAMEKLKISAKDMVSKVSTLLETVKNVEDECSKGVKSLKSAIDAIEADLADYRDNSKPPEAEINPEELLHSTKSITLASAKAVAAGKSCKQADVSACVDLGRKAVEELLKFCKGVASNAENDSDKDRILATGQTTAEAFKRLLELVHSVVMKPTSENKSKLTLFSQEVADKVRELMAAAESIRGEAMLEAKTFTSSVGVSDVTTSDEHMGLRGCSAASTEDKGEEELVIADKDEELEQIPAVLPVLVPTAPPAPPLPFVDHAMWPWCRKNASDYFFPWKTKLKH